MNAGHSLQCKIKNQTKHFLFNIPTLQKLKKIIHDVDATATTARPECSCPTGVRLESLRPCNADPDPVALAAGQLQNKVQAVLPRPCHSLWSQPGVSNGNSPASRHQQITFRATLIFHLIDKLLCTTAVHEVRRAGVLTCGSCHLERSAQQHPHRG